VILIKAIDEIVNGSYKVTEKQDMLYKLKKGIKCRNR